LERSLGRSKKKSVAKPDNNSVKMSKSSNTRKPVKNSEASARFKMITDRAKKIRQAHPNMKWKNCIKQASQELYK